MGHHYSGGRPQEYLDDQAQKISNIPLETVERGELSFKGIDEALESLDTQKTELRERATAEITALGMASKLGGRKSHRITSDHYEILEMVSESESETPEQLHRESDYLRSEFFNIATDLSTNGYLNLENGNISLTEEGYNAIEGIKLLQDNKESF